MKSILLLSVFESLVCANQSWACSELGAQDFTVSRDMQKTCGKIALQYASGLAEQMVNVEKREANYKGPLNPLVAEKEIPTLYKTQKRSGNSKIIGFNVSLNSKNKFECNFCVDMSLDERGYCRIESIEKFMCAN